MSGRLTRRPHIHRPRLAKLVHSLRVALVAALLLAIPSPATKSVSDGTIAPSIDQLRNDQLRIDSTTEATELQIETEPDGNGMWRVVDGQNNVVALVARTLPAAKEVVGYRGPTEASIVFDSDLNIVSVGLLDSADTEEHVNAVVNDEGFFAQFEGWPWGGPPEDAAVDGVSGATLTSLALAEGVLARIGGARPSLVFGEPLSTEEIRDWYADAFAVDDDGGDVRNAKGDSIGRVLRSGPHSDAIIGYQGPTELLMKLSPSNQVESIRIRRSFDNEPYVDYVRVEAGFWKKFEGKSLSELGDFDPQEAGIEGVSGATMTSLAVADTIVAAAKAADNELTAKPESPTRWWESMRWTRADAATIMMLLAAATFSRLGWFRVHALRRFWLLAVTLVIGLWAGNLISMALVAGWSAEGVAWRLAPDFPRWPQSRCCCRRWPRTTRIAITSVRMARSNS